MRDTALPAATHPSGQNELPGMLATLCSYENFFGPYHPQTLKLRMRAGRPEVPAIAALRDLFIAQHDYERAGAAQRELLK